jgi:branched-chain amino acid transport system ATP-binding protein
MAAIKQAREEGTTILMVEQNLEVAARLGDYYAVMDNGRIVQQGAMSALVADSALQNRLLGFSLAAGGGQAGH